MKRWLGFMFVLSILGGCQEEILDESPAMSEVLIEEGTIEEILPLKNEAINNFSVKLNQLDLGIVIHNPDDKMLSDLSLATYSVQPIDESILFVPQYFGSEIRLYEVEWVDDELIEGKLLFEVLNMKNKEAFYLQCPVPEGIPMMKAVLTYEKKSIEYIITYDGSGMRPNVEVLTPKQI